jgi:hypothetical protein
MLRKRRREDNFDNFFTQLDRKLQLTKPIEPTSYFKPVKFDFQTAKFVKEQADLLKAACSKIAKVEGAKSLP